MGVYTDRTNLKLIEKEEKDGLLIEVFEYEHLTASSLEQSASLFYAQKSGIKVRQCVITLNGTSGVQLSPGAMSFTLGNIEMTSNIKGVGDFIGKAFSAKVTGEQAIKPLYKGKGEIALELSYRHFLIALLEDEEYCMDDGLFYAASEKISVKAKLNTRLSSAALGGEGIFNLAVKGTGLLLIESKVPMEEIVIVELNNDVLKVDGNFAILWSGCLDFTVEKSGKSLVGSAVSGEGLVNVYRGTGVVWLAPTAKIIR